MYITTWKKSDRSNIIDYQMKFFYNILFSITLSLYFVFRIIKTFYLYSSPLFNVIILVYITAFFLSATNGLMLKDTLKRLIFNSRSLVWLPDHIFLMNGSICIEQCLKPIERFKYSLIFFFLLRYKENLSIYTPVVKIFQIL